MESDLETRFWNDESAVLIETILAALGEDEILYELREHSAGGTAGAEIIFLAISHGSAIKEATSCLKNLC